MLIGLVSCGKKDVTPPEFNNANNGRLADITINKGDSINLLDGVTAIDDVDKTNVTITIKNDDGFNSVNPGIYVIEYLATDKANNKATAIRKVIVSDVDEVKLEFDNVSNGFLPSLTVTQGDNVDLLAGITAKDNNNNSLTVVIKDDNGFDKDVPGIYRVVYEATGLNGDKIEKERLVCVVTRNSITYDALVVDGENIKYTFNSETALQYSSSGAKFRNLDEVQVMTKEFFIEKFNQYKGDFSNNAGFQYFPSGVIVFLDNDLNFKYIQIAPSALEVDENGVVKTTGLDWNNNTIDANAGSGNFKNILTRIEQKLPNGGYVLFAPPKDPQLGKKFLVRKYFFSGYIGGTVAAGDFNVDVKNVKTSFVDDYEYVITEDEYANETKNAVIKHDSFLDGIPVTTYYYNDGQPKPVIFFFHGFSGGRVSGIADRGDELAKRGFYVVAMDAYLHGDRAPAYFKALTYGEQQQEIVNIQIQTAKDAKHLYEKYYKSNKYVQAGDVYTFGVSMGGGTAIYLGTIMKEVKTIISLLGSPSFYEFYQEKQNQYKWEVNNYYFTNLYTYLVEDPLINYKLLQDKNIFLASGSKDDTVPYKYAEAFKTKFPTNDNIFYKLYDTAHSSTPEMHTDAYEFLLNHK
jgi:hypothetical protein